MDMSVVTDPILRILWLLLPLGILAAVIKSPWFKGLVGEWLVNLSSKWLLNKNDYYLIKNVTLPTADGTTQVDHVLVSKYGVFVVETKSLKGWIFGSANQKTWTQKIYRHSNRFQNPLHQNYKHVKTLQMMLGLDDHQIHSVVAFMGDCTFKTPMPANVTRGAGYTRYIKSVNAQVLTPEDVREIIEKIEAGRLAPSLKTNREHVRHVKSIVELKQYRDRSPSG